METCIVSSRCMMHDSVFKGTFIVTDNVSINFKYKFSENKRAHNFFMALQLHIVIVSLPWEEKA